MGKRREYGSCHVDFKKDLFLNFMMILGNETIQCSLVRSLTINATYTVGKKCIIFLDMKVSDNQMKTFLVVL